MGIKHVVPLAAAGLVLVGCGWAGGGETFTDEAAIGQGISTVRFNNDSGNVKITIGDEVSVRRRVTYGDGDKPGKTYKVEGGDTLVLSPCQATNCSVDYELTVAAGTKVDGQVDSGAVELVGVAAVNVESESGDITVRNVSGAVNASAQSGRITLADIGGTVVAAAESGDVSVGLANQEDVTVTTSSGRIEVTVPDGGYQVTTSADSGAINSELDDDASAEYALTLQAGSGDITVRKA